MIDLVSVDVSEDLSQIFVRGDGSRFQKVAALVLSELSDVTFEQRFYFPWSFSFRTYSPSIVLMEIGKIVGTANISFENGDSL